VLVKIYSSKHTDTPDGRCAVVQYCADYETVFGSYTETLTGWTTMLFGDDQMAVTSDTGKIDAPTEPVRSNVGSPMASILL
jgi:hypothetical protein